MGKFQIQFSFQEGSYESPCFVDVQCHMFEAPLQGVSRLNNNTFFGATWLHIEIKGKMWIYLGWKKCKTNNLHQLAMFQLVSMKNKRIYFTLSINNGRVAVLLSLAKMLVNTACSMLKYYHNALKPVYKGYILLNAYIRRGFHHSMSRFSSRWSVQQEESFISCVCSFVCSVVFPVQCCLAVNHVMHSSRQIRSCNFLDNITVNN